MLQQLNTSLALLYAHHNSPIKDGVLHKPEVIMQYFLQGKYIDFTIHSFANSKRRPWLYATAADECTEELYGMAVLGTKQADRASWRGILAIWDGLRLGSNFWSICA